MGTIRRLTVSIALLSLTPLAAQWGAIQANTPPSAREDAMLGYDLLNQRMLMFGGNYTNEFWSLQNGTWTQLTPAVLPPVRRRGAMATNPFVGEILIYGGQGNTGGSTALDDTWLWNGTTWQQMFPAVSPGGMMWHGMSYHTSRGVSVAFGGQRIPGQLSSLLNETWEYSVQTNTWTQVFPTIVPDPRTRPAMCYHPTIDRTILFGGEVWNGISDETWIYDGVTWTEINTTGPKPPARLGGQMVQNLIQGVVVLHGGFDPNTWTILNDTWEHDGTNWREIDNVYGGVYPPRENFAMGHDIPRDRVIVFGGKIANGSLRNDLWEYGAHWQPFGIGCAGSAGTPTLTGTELPRLGFTAEAEISNVPPAIPFAFMAIGLSRQQWALGNLPMLLDSLGMPGCRAYTSADLIVALNATAGVAEWTFPIPSQPDLVGAAFYLQGITLDPGINAMGLAMSNAATLIVGN